MAKISTVQKAAALRASGYWIGRGNNYRNEIVDRVYDLCMKSKIDHDRWNAFGMAHKDWEHQTGKFKKLFAAGTSATESSTPNKPPETETPAQHTPAAPKTEKKKPPLKLTNLRVKNITKNEALYLWDPVEGANDYKVVESRAGNDENAINSFYSNGETRFQAATLRQGTRYTVKVVAFDSEHRILCKNSTSFTTKGAPGDSFAAPAKSTNKSAAATTQGAAKPKVDANNEIPILQHRLSLLQDLRRNSPPEMIKELLGDNPDTMSNGRFQTLKREKIVAINERINKLKGGN
jgi:hypothetical protein